MRARSKVRIECRACGHNGIIREHKLCKFIVRQEGKQKKKKTEKEDSPAVRPEPEISVADADVIWFSDTSKEAQDKRRQEELYPK